MIRCWRNSRWSCERGILRTAKGGGGIVRAAGETIVRVAGDGVVRATGEGEDMKS